MTKGKRRERQAAELYEEAGYETQPFRGTRYGEKDGFGLFDFIAIGWEPTPVHLVQVKSNRAKGIEAWGDEALTYASKSVRVRMMVCHDREGWRVIDPVPGGHEVVLDERELDCEMGVAVAGLLEP